MRRGSAGRSTEGAAHPVQVDMATGVAPKIVFAPPEDAEEVADSGDGNFRGQSPDPDEAVTSVSITGGSGRIEHAVAMLAEGKGKRLLVAGADPSVTKADLGELSRAKDSIFSDLSGIERVQVSDEHELGGPREREHHRCRHGAQRVLLNDCHPPGFGDELPAVAGPHHTHAR